MDVGPDDERRQVVQERVANWASAGCFRITRVGDQLTSLFAPEGSDVFRVLTQESIAADIPVEDVLLELATRGSNTASVVWKNLSIRAEGLE
ncbi:MAG: DUF1583 domain-containing protein [Pirellulaceae bacterium]